MAKRQGKLKDIHIKEVSLVDLPANKLPFLFFKREGDSNDPVKKQKKIEIGIVSDGTVVGTTVSVNGKKLGKLKSFDFSFYGGDPKGTIHASYTKAASDSDGFSRTETYYLNKGEVMKKETLKALQAYLGTEEIDFEKKVSEEDIAKALTLIAKEYKDSFPEDLENAVGVIAKCATAGCETKDNKEDVSKAGAKFSKDALKKLKAVIEAIEALKSILPEGEEKQKSNSDDSSELAKQIALLSETLTKTESKNTDAKDDDLSKKLTEALDSISKRLKTVEESGGVKKGLDDEGGDDSGDGDKGDSAPKWPTLTGQK